MAHSFIAYIDESGDDGLSGRYREPGRRGGSSHWLTLSASIWRYSRDLEAIEWRDAIRNQLGHQVRKVPLHCKDFNHQQKVMAAHTLRAKPFRTICVLANKASIPEGTYVGKNQLYFYMCRYLIERISWFCRAARPKVPEGDGRAKMIFSRRGGLSYPNFIDYLRRLQAFDDPENIQINWMVIDAEGIEARDHSTRAGLQIADIMATCVTAGLEPDLYGNQERRYAEILKPQLYERNGNYLSYGVKMFPHPDQLELNEQQRAFVDLFR
ncbi:DUF3800 domain-containing protein [Sphingomonas lutea]|uniref:DUF3800 domain-containing protein n=1 Tax=Sphingomonas lutea TaxID=1045317 RepID=A0A7G9SK71_9SPHN|nr:DUF3800 domain-containing protein [Sphingomonas lutea]QNN68246.1 DUF3800 domain-containing protein [Sphingomonas lutea]